MNKLEEKFNADLEERVEKMESVVAWTNAFKKGALWAFQWFSRQQQWISVKDDRKPEQGEPIIVGNADATGYAVYHGTQFWKPAAFPLEITDVTHWMPLPEPPKP